MLVSSMGMITGRAISMALGFVFWVLAARLFAPESVGLAAGAIAAMMLCTQLGALGLGSAFITLFPRYQDRASVLLDTAITVVALGSLVAGAFFLFLSSVAFAELDVVAASVAFTGLFFAMCVLGTVNIVLDQVSMAVGQGAQVLSRNVLFGCVAAVSLVVLAATTDEASSLQLFSLWVAAGVGACLMGGVHLRRSLARYRFRPRVEGAVAARLIRVGLPNHALTLTERAPGLVLPIVVTELLSPAQNAFWYTIWMMAWVAYIIPISMGVALFAEVSHRPESLPAAVRSAARSALGLGSAAAAGLALFASFFLGIMGDEYAAQGSTPLRILLVGFLPLTFVQVYFAACRATRRLPEAVLVGAASGLAAVVSAALAARPYGLAGMAWAWVVTQYVVGAWALVRVRRLNADSVRPPMASSATEAPIPPGPSRHRRDGRRRPHLEPRPGPRRARPVSLASVSLLLVAALFLWLRSVRQIDLRAMDDLGLVSVLPVLALVALAILTVSFCLLLRSFPSRVPLMLLHLGILILMLYGATAFVEEVPRFAVSWRHAGIADHIARKGSVDTRIDAYFNWPGFFILAALLSELTGFANPISFTRWASVYFNLLFLAPLVLILRAVTDDPRVVWLAVWIFFLTNWVGQDYFSPQAFAYFLYLVILAILLTWFRSVRGVGTHERGDERTGARHRWLTRPLRLLWWREPGELHDDGLITAPVRVGLMAIVIIVFAVMVGSHQLTPFAALISVTALVAARRCAARGLPVLMTVVVVTWVAFMTGAYLASHLSGVTSGLGDLSKNAEANIGNRLRGTPEHLFVLRVRLAMTAGLWVLALLGALRRFGHRHRDVACGVLALAPFSLLAMQSYGGEILLRIYLLSLPFVAFFAAAFFFPLHRSEASRAKTVQVGLITVAMLVAFFFARYGNERANQFTSSEIQAIDHLYSISPRGSVLVAGSENVPWRSRHYADYRHRTLTALAEQRQQPLPRLEDVASLVMERPDRRLFVLITRSQKAHVELLGIWPPESLDGLESQLAGSPLFKLVFANRDATIFEANAWSEDEQ